MTLTIGPFTMDMGPFANMPCCHDNKQSYLDVAVGPFNMTMWQQALLI